MKPQIVVIGSLNMDLVTVAERFPQQGETLLGRKFSQFFGGKGANQAVAASRLGPRVSMIGAVGDDAFGQQLTEALIKENIETKGIRTVANVSTGVAQITLANQDNSIIVVPGANYECTPEWVIQNKDLIKQADMVMIQLEIPIETVEIALEISKVYHKPVILNPAPAQALSAELLAKVTYLTPNETELEILTSSSISKQEDEEKALQKLTNTGVNHVIVTKGNSGSVFINADHSITHVPSYQVDAVDTTGAGDAFNAGLAVAIVEGKSLQEAVRFATAVSALAVTKHGAQAGMPTRDDVEEFIQLKGAQTR